MPFVAPSEMRKLTRTSSGSVTGAGTASSLPVRRHDAKAALTIRAKKAKLRMIPFDGIIVDCQIFVFCQTSFHEWMLMLMLTQW